jgi:hypothetical protein
MKSLTLTPQDVEQFAESGRHALGLFLGQYALIAPKFPTVTREALDAMMVNIAKDPQGTGSTPGIDVAVYYAAFFQIGAHKLDGDIEALVQAPDAATLHSLFQRIYACANTVNALTLLGQGGLMPQLHVDEAQSVARTKVAKDAADKRHAPKNAARDWVIAEYLRDAGEYESKADFARIYAGRVPVQFKGVKVTAETIAEKWLRSK